MKLKKIAVLVVAYASAWWVTGLVGTPQVGDEALRWLVAANGDIPPSTASVEEWWTSDEEGERASPFPTYHAEPYSPVPFVVLVDEGTIHGSRWANGGTSVYVWLFGFTWRAAYRPEWIS